MKKLLCLWYLALAAVAGAQTKISELPSLTGSGATSTDVLPIVDVSAGNAGSKKITLAELFSTPVPWNGELISAAKGGTGINNSGKTITLGGNLATIGSGPLALTTTGSTALTLPTSGTLATTAEVAEKANEWEVEDALEAKAGTSGEGIDTPDKSTDFLLATRALGSQRLTEGNKSALSRWWTIRERRGWQTPGSYDASRSRVVDLGDSTTAPFGRALSRRMGFGGTFDKAKTAPGVTHTGTTTADQWTRSLSGSVTRLANTQTLTYQPATALTGIWVQYLAKSGNGSIQLSYETNKTGGYTTSTNNWIVESMARYGVGFNGSPAIVCSDSTGLQTGMSVSGTGVPGGTTISAINPDTSVSTTASTTSGSAVITVASVSGLVRGMRVETATGQGAMIHSIAPGSSQVTLSATLSSTGSGVAFTFRGKNLILSANLTGDSAGILTFTRSDAGSSSGGTGTLNTDNATTEKFCTAFLAVPNSGSGADYYNIRLTATGNVDICGIGTECGGLGLAYNGSSVQPGGVIYGNYGEGGKLVSTHFNTTPADIFNRSLGWLNPEIITFKGLNDWNIPTLAAEVSPGVTLWDQYIGKIHAAAPNALIIVFSTHVTQAFPSPDATNGYVEMDAWMRNWCAQSGYALFIDARQNYVTNSQIQGDPANLTSDGLHQNSNGDDMRGLGEEWNVALAIDAVMPVLQNTGPFSARAALNNSTRWEQGSPNLSALYIPDSGGVAPTFVKRAWRVPPRTRAFLGFSPSEGVANGAVPYGDENATGIGMRPMGSGIDSSPGALELISNGSIVAAFGNYHFSGQAPLGAFFGGSNTSVPDALRNDGWRFLQPWNGYGNREGLVVQSQTGNTAATFAINAGGSVSAKGTRAFAWFAESGDITLPKTITAGGTTGAQTINKLTGSVNFAALAGSLVVTNNLVTSASVINLTKGTNDSTARLGAAVAGSGSFTIHMDVAPAAECRVNFTISN